MKNSADNDYANGTRIKIHVIHGDTGSNTRWGGLYVGSNIKHYKDGTNTLHVPLLVSRNSPGKDTTAHELAHALQDLSGAEFFNKRTLRGKFSTGTIHDTHYDQYRVDSRGVLTRAQPQPPRGRRARVNRQNEGRPFSDWGSNYFHQGVELNARMLENIPTILSIVDQHHKNHGYEDFVKEHSSKIETEAKKFTSPEAQKKYREQQYDKLHDLLSSKFIQAGGQQQIFTRNAGAGDPSLGRVVNPKGAIAVRNEKLKEKQNKNLWELGSYVNERQINSLIRAHSGHDVAASRKTREEERNRPRPIQTTQPTEQETQQKKPSLFQRFKQWYRMNV